MSFRRIILFAVLLLVVLPVGYCTYYFWPYAWSQKMTVEVETPEGVKTGSSVVRVNWRKNDPLGSINGPRWLSQIWGEAPVVELPGKKYLFALLSHRGSSSYAANIALRTMPSAKWRSASEWAKNYVAVRRSRGKVEKVKPENYPLLVTFSDITKPETVKRVDPDNLAATFGPGHALKSITLEITNEAVTRGKVEQVLGDDFFGANAKIHKEALARGLNDPYFNSFLSKLHRGDFVKGAKK